MARNIMPKFLKAAFPAAIFIMMSTAPPAGCQETHGDPESWQTGTIISEVTCSAVEDQKYSLYLPSSYHPENKYPILYAFDPAARGTIPVELFRNAAEKYGYIMAGSLNARNGPWEPIARSMIAIWNDTQARFAIDPDRIFAVGFSGGARSASLLPQVVKKKIAGIIGCGASWASGVEPNNISPSYFIGIIGNQDFNYIEMLNLNKRLSELNFPHRIMEFDGQHRWPSSDLCTQAVEWMEIFLISAGKRSKNPEFIQEIFNREYSQAKKWVEAGDIYRGVRELETLESFFLNLLDTGKISFEISTLKDTHKYQEGKGLVDRLIKWELQMVGSLRHLVGQLDSSQPLITEIENLFERYGIENLLRDTQAEEISKRNRAYRLLSSLLMSLRERGIGYLQEGKAEKSIIFFESAIRAGRNHIDFLPSFHYYLGLGYSSQRNKKQALKNLEEAVQLGLNDSSLFDREPLLDFLRETPEYRALTLSLKKKLS